MKKSIIKTFVIFSVFILSHTNASAYGDNYLNELESHPVWNKKTVKVWVQPCGYSKTVFNAFREWMIAANNCVRFVDANTKNSADIKVYFLPALPKTNGADSAGITYTKHNGKIIYSAEVNLRYVKPDGKTVVTNEEMYPVAVHEIGHALGLMGHSSNRNDVMFPNTNIIGVHTSNRDFNSIRTMYCK